VAIGIRTTKIEDLTGDLKIINNSEIRGAVNTSNSLHPAICDVGLSYGTDIERFERLIHEELPRLREMIPDIQEGPFYKGVQELGESAVVLRILARTEEAKKYQVVRDLNREVKLFCDKNGFEIPFNQLVVHVEKTGGKTKAEPDLPDPVFLDAAENGVKIEPRARKPKLVRPEIAPEKIEPLRIQEEEITGQPVAEAKVPEKETKPVKSAPKPKPATESPVSETKEAPVPAKPKKAPVSAEAKPAPKEGTPVSSAPKKAPSPAVKKTPEPKAGQ